MRDTAANLHRNAETFLCRRADDVTSKADAALATSCWPGPSRSPVPQRSWATAATTPALVERRAARPAPMRSGPGGRASRRLRRPGRSSRSRRPRAAGRRRRRCAVDRRPDRPRSPRAHRRRRPLRGPAQGWPPRRAHARPGAAGARREAARPRRARRAARSSRWRPTAGSSPSPAGAPTRAQGRRTARHPFDWRLATDVWAPAASVFKLVTASALVAAGVDPSDKVCFHGGLRSVQESNLRDDKRDSRCESLTYGVAHSNNAILGKLAFQKLAPAELDPVRPRARRRRAPARCRAARRRGRDRAPLPRAISSFAADRGRVRRFAALGGRRRDARRHVRRRRRAADAVAGRLDRRRRGAGSGQAPRGHQRGRPGGRPDDGRRPASSAARRESFGRAPGDPGRRQDRHAHPDRAVLHGALVVRRLRPRRAGQRSSYPCCSGTRRTGTCAATRPPAG